MRDVKTATDLARELDTALGSALQVLRMIQYGGQASSDELRRIVDMGERVRTRAAWISDGKIGRDDRVQNCLPVDATPAGRPQERRP